MVKNSLLTMASLLIFSLFPFRELLFTCSSEIKLKPQTETKQNPNERKRF